MDAPNSPLLTPELFRQAVRRDGSADAWVVALSGGVDSVVLLHLAVAAGLGQHGLRALHIHHGLHCEADRWAEHCRQLCAQWHIELEVVRVRVGARGGVEAAAREARYAVFSQQLALGEVLLMAHHGDDQAETLLLRLMRGAGPRGLGAMPVSRALGAGRLLRPLLAYSRAQILRYADLQQLSWVEDPSNQSDRYDRNYLRHQVLPLLRQRWQGADQVLQRTAHLCSEADELNQALAAQDLACDEEAGPGLSCRLLQGLSLARQCNLLRYWLANSAIAMPARSQLLRIIDEVVGARGDAQPVLVLGDRQVVRYRERLYVRRSDLSAAPQENLLLPWDLKAALTLPRGVLLAEHGREHETDRGQGQGQGQLQLPADARVDVRYRRGGERCRPVGRSGSQALKKLLQEAGVPPWERPWLPLIYCNGELAAVADLWVCEGFQAAGDGAGVGLTWIREDRDA